MAGATKDEENAIKIYAGLMSAKTKEVNALAAQIEVEINPIGEISVEIEAPPKFCFFQK